MSAPLKRYAHSFHFSLCSGLKAKDLSCFVRCSDLSVHELSHLNNSLNHFAVGLSGSRGRPCSCEAPAAQRRQPDASIPLLSPSVCPAALPLPALRMSDPLRGRPGPCCPGQQASSRWGCISAWAAMLSALHGHTPVHAHLVGTPNAPPKTSVK